MSLITLNIEKKHYYLILGILIFILEDLIIYKNNKQNYDNFNNNCNIYFLNFVSKIFLIIPYFIIIHYQSKDQIIIFRNKSIVSLNKIYDFKFLPQNKKFRNFIIILLSLYIFSELYSIFIFLQIPNKLMKLHRYKMAYFVFLIYFYKILFNKTLFVHHYLSLIILFIVLFILLLNNIFILKHINYKRTQIFLLLHDLVGRCLSAFNIIFFKYLMEICYMNGYLIFFILGIIQIVISLFICLIIKFTLFEFPKSLIIIIYYFFRNFFIIFFIQKFNPCLYGIIYFGYDLYYYFIYCKNKDGNIKLELKIMFQIIFVFAFFVLFIFSETIQFNFCGLNKHTIVNKIEKSKKEEEIAKLDNDNSENKDKINFEIF